MHSASDACPTIGVRALVAELAELPANPAVALRVVQLLDDPRTDVARLARLVESDPSLAAHALRLANAPLRGTARGVTSARQAVLALGFELVRSLASLAAGGVDGDQRPAAPASFWRHSVTTAAAAAVVARRVGHDPGEAWAAGLLHDLGSALQFRAAPARYEAMVAASPDDPAGRAATELLHFELDHADAGAAVLQAWGFPDPLVAVVRDHHRPPTPTTPDLVLVARAGEAVADRLGVCDPGEPPADLDAALGLVGLDAGDAAALVDAAAADADAVVGPVLGAATAPSPRR